MLTSTSLTLVLGATGKTGSRIANRLLSRGLPVRTAARSGADAHFDWDDPETYAPALHGIKRVYLLRLVMQQRPSSTRRPSPQSRARHWPTRRFMPAPSTHSPVPRHSRWRRQPRSSATSAAGLLTTPTLTGAFGSPPR